MNEAVEVTVEEIGVGDLVHFPNSRKPQEVDRIMDDAKGSITLYSGSAQWVIKRGLTVRRVPKEEGTSDD